jgi:hypothetical protein
MTVGKYWLIISMLRIIGENIVMEGAMMDG